MTIKDRFNQFVDNVNGQFIEVSYKEAIYQCMDLAYLWVFCLGYPKATIQHLYAYQVFTEPNDLTRQYFDIIPNTPDGIPQDGDLVVYKGGEAGHIVIALSGGTTNTFKCFEQNNPLGTNAHIQSRNYTNVLGWLRPKSQSIGEQEEKGIVMELIEEGFASLPDSDNLKQGNLEGYIRALIGEHPKIIPDADKQGTDAQVTKLKEDIQDISLALKMPLSENNIDDMVKKIVKLKTTETNYIKFVEYVAESIDCEKTETAVREALTTLASLRNDIKKKRLEEFGTWERIFSGLTDLFKRR